MSIAAYAGFSSGGSEVISINIYAVFSENDSDFAPRIEAVAPHDSIRIEAVAPHDSIQEGYYRLRISQDLCLMISDDQCRQLLEVLGSRPPLPKSDAQIDAEREDTGFAPGAGGAEVFRG